MAEFGSVSKKRKLAQLEDETQFSSSKKIKAEKNSNEEGNFSFSDLPHEIIHFILSFITNDTQRRHIRLVCQQWFDCINYNEFKIGLLLASEVEQFSRCVGRYQKPIALKFMKLSCLYNLDNRLNSYTTLMKSAPMFHSMLSPLTQLTALDLRLEDFEVPPELVNLQSLTVTTPIHQNTMSRLTNLRRLKTIGFQSIQVPATLESLDLSINDRVSIEIDSSYSRLTELNITSRKLDGCEIPKDFTNLRKLSLGLFGAPKLFIGDYQMMIPLFSTEKIARVDSKQLPNLEEFIAGDSTLLPTLTKLHVLSSTEVEINEDLTQLKDLQCFKVKLNGNYRLHELEDCVVQFDNAALTEQLDSEKVTKLRIAVNAKNINTLSRFTNLVDLDVSLDSMVVDARPDLVPLTNLTQLTLSYSNYPHNWMTLLPNLVNLKVLQGPHFSPTLCTFIGFETMPQLTSLELRGNYGIISIINLTNLLHLDINNQNTLHSIKINGLSTVTNLTSLSVNQKLLNKLSVVAESTELALLTNLRMLSLGRNSSTEDVNVADLTTLQHLTFLEIRTSSESTWYLTKLTRLQKVDLYASDLLTLMNEPADVDAEGILQFLPFCYQFEEFGPVSKKRKLALLEDETQFSSNKKIKAGKKVNEEGNILFSDLPREIIHFILSFITSDTQRRQIRSVCQQWFDYINYNEFKIGVLLTSEVEEFSQCFGRYQKPIGLKFRKIGYLGSMDSIRNYNKTLIRSSHVFQSMLSSLTQLTALDLQLKNFEIPQELVNLQSLTVIRPLSRDMIPRLTNLRRLKTNSQLPQVLATLESLDLSDSEQIDITIDRSYSSLTELTISTTTRCEIPDALTNLRRLSEMRSNPFKNLMQKCPNLEEFITSVDSEQLPDQYPSTLTKLNMLSFCSRLGVYNELKINQDLTQLKDLQCYKVKLCTNSRMNLLEDCVVQNNYETILEQLDAQKVTKLRISVVPENIHSCCIWSKFTNLIDLEIALDQAITNDVITPYLVQLTRLTQLQLSYNIYPQQWMKQLTNLVELRLRPQTSTTAESINFEMMHHLTSLVLLGGSYDSIGIVSLNNLAYLHIENENTSKAIQIHGLSTVTNLTFLVCQNYHFKAVYPPPPLQNFQELASLTKLRVLVFNRRNNTAFTDITYMTALQHLTFLEVRAISQSTWCLTKLTRLQKVYMYANDPSKVDWDRLKSLPLCYHFEGNFIQNNN